MLEQWPKVTICALSFNTGTYTELAIRSALATNYPNLEIICIDDGSSDSSSELLSSLSEELGFSFYKNATNLGIPETCNIGLKISTGEYFVLIGDDLMLPNRIHGDVKVLELNPSMGFVSSVARVIDSTGETLEGSTDWAGRLSDGPLKENPRGVWLSGSKIFTPTATYRTSMLRKLGGWDNHFDVEDKPMFIKFASEGVSGWARNEVTTLYRRHDSNYSAKFRIRMFSQELDLLKKFSISISTWQVALKFIVEAHYWMLFLRATPEQMSSALTLAGLQSWAWTVRSHVLKVAFFLMSFARRRRYVTRHSRFYFSKTERDLVEGVL
jgi:glycosyltransferase involved in cell wall biosynthesis